jgi:uncharacterized protein
MPVKVNLRLLKEDEESVPLEGDLPLEEFAGDLADPQMKFAEPLHYELSLDLQPDALLVQGSLSTRLACECSRCLKPFSLDLAIDDFAALAPLAGEDAISLEGDFGDLTPLLREDIYLSLPTNPLCKPECRGLARKASARDSRLEASKGEGPSPWAALDQLELLTRTKHGRPKT